MQPKGTDVHMNYKTWNDTSVEQENLFYFHFQLK